MDSGRLYQKYTIAELVELRREIEADPANQQKGLYKYTAKARKKIDAIAWAITLHLRDKNDNPAKDFGYTGRQSNRR